jgi:predicted enzyme related to lactoylglutathione lyase
MSDETSEHAMPVPGSFCWTEIASSDSEKCKEFYSRIFGWEFQGSNATEGEFAYHEFSAGGEAYPAGGMYDLSPEMGSDTPPHFLSYVAVDDVDATAQKAVELGASIIREPMDIPNTGRFAVIKDPAGALIATFRMQS